MTDHPRAIGLLAHVARGLLRHDQLRTTRRWATAPPMSGLSDVGPRRHLLGRRSHPNSTDSPSIPTDNHWLQNGAKRSISRSCAGRWCCNVAHCWRPWGGVSRQRRPGDLAVGDIVPGQCRCGHSRLHLRSQRVPYGHRVLELMSTEHLPQTLYPATRRRSTVRSSSRPVLERAGIWGSGAKRTDVSPTVPTPLLDHPARPPKDVDIEGWVLCLAMSDVKAFGPYRTSMELLGLCLRTAGPVDDDAGCEVGRIDLDDVASCSGFHPLCELCDTPTAAPSSTPNPVLDPALDASWQPCPTSRRTRPTGSSDRCH
jgi:hypothetical protein